MIGFGFDCVKKPAALALLGLVILGVAAPVHAQLTLPPPAPTVAATPASAEMSSDEVARKERKKALDAIQQTIRESYVRGDYQASLDACAQAEKIDPANASARLYRELIQRKLASGAAATKATPEFGTSFSASAVAPRSATPAATAAPAAAAEQAVKPAAQSENSAASSEAVSQQTRSTHMIVIGGVAALLLTGAILLLSKRRKKQDEPLPEAPISLPGELARPASATRRTAAAGASAPNLLFANLPDDDDAAGESSIAEDIAKNLGTSSTSPSLGSSFEFAIPSATDDPADLPEGEVSAFHETMPTVIEAPADEQQAEPAKESEEEEDSLSLAMPELNLDQPAPAAPPAPTPATAPSASAESAGETVSFDDLGIVLLDESQSKAEPAPAPAAAPAPAPAQPHDEPIVISADLVRPDPAPQPAKTPDPGETVAQAARPEGIIDLDDLLFGTSAGMTSTNAAPAVAQPAPAQPAKKDEESETLFPPSPKPSPIVEDEAETLFQPPKMAPKSAASSDEDPDWISKTFGALEDTFHSEETLKISPQQIGVKPQPAEDSDATRTYTPSMSAAAQSPAQDETRMAPPSTPSPNGGEAPLDERSEKMFREQFDRGNKALADKDWKQAVHYLSIAAAISPDNEQVRSLLRQAREEKRRQDGAN